MTRDDLIAFEADIAAEFNAGHIRAPIHLDGGNEDQLIEIFKQVLPNDWVLCSWRSHYKALLKGIPPEKVKAEIMAGRSISLCFPEHRFLSSAIVGGILPIALGIAWSIKRHSGEERVWAFIGDMAARGGMFRECFEYADGNCLPITFVVENNKKSVCTDTVDVWGGYSHFDVGSLDDEPGRNPSTILFDYTLPWPHSGAGKRVQF